MYETAVITTPTLSARIRYTSREGSYREPRFTVRLYVVRNYVTEDYSMLTAKHASLFHCLYDSNLYERCLDLLIFVHTSYISLYNIVYLLLYRYIYLCTFECVENYIRSLLKLHMKQNLR